LQCQDHWEAASMIHIGTARGENVAFFFPSPESLGR
jgi:hypothetical protein